MSEQGTKRRDFLRVGMLGLVGASALGPWRAHAAVFGGDSSSAAEAGDLDLRFRQIHLDFHTSPLIPGIGARFDPDEFAATLEKARVDSVTCFGRGHHGYIYYDTTAFPERHHPHLTRNLLAEQIEACHRRDIRVPIYITIQWDQFTADAEPGWRQVTASGGLQGTPPFDPGFYRLLCLNSPYVGFLKAHLKELFEVMPVDGLFLDIVKEQDCACPRCLRGMREQGLDAAADEVRQAFGREVTRGFRSDLTAFIRTLDPDCSIFYNGGHVGPELRPSVPTYTHFELESLPSGGWGYLHFPISMRYARTLGKDCMGMTGRFHTSWGDFHSLKNPAALQFECFQMLALGAKCSVGDQLHPSGRIDPATYDLIGGVYAEVERKEPWCHGARPVVDIGVFAPEEFTGGRTPPPAMGVTRMLQETAHQFDFVDSTTPNIERYKVLVLPDEITVDPALKARLTAYLAAGGAMVASYHSGLAPDREDFALPQLGVRLVGDAPFSPDYIRPRAALDADWPDTELVMYLQGLEVEAVQGEVVADVVAPYFNRTWEHYSSHRHTPSTGEVAYPGAVRTGNVVYFAHPVFTQYSQNAPRWCRTLVLNAIDLLLPEPVLRVEGPSTLLTAVNAQDPERRWVVHLLHYVPERRGQDFDVIEDVIPVDEVGVSLRFPGRVRAVKTVPQGKKLRFAQRGERVHCVLPRLDGHQMLAFELR